MPRMMSFALTTKQFRDRTKHVTRRNAWWDLKPGDVLMAVEKAQGLKKGEKVVKLGLIEVVSTRPERLNEITQEECILEGFPEYEPRDFVQMFLTANNSRPDEMVNRIEYDYLKEIEGLKTDNDMFWTREVIEAAAAYGLVEMKSPHWDILIAPESLPQNSRYHLVDGHILTPDQFKALVTPSEVIYAHE